MPTHYKFIFVSSITILIWHIAFYKLTQHRKVALFPVSFVIVLMEILCKSRLELSTTTAASKWNYRNGLGLEKFKKKNHSVKDHSVQLIPDSLLKCINLFSSSYNYAHWTTAEIKRISMNDSDSEDMTSNSEETGENIHAWNRMEKEQNFLRREQDLRMIDTIYCKMCDEY